MMIRVLIAAAYASVRAGLQSLLEAQGCEVVGQASNPRELEALLFKRPDVVLLDLPESHSESGADEEGGAGTLENIASLLARAEVAVVLMGDAVQDFELLLACPLRGWAWLAREADGCEIAAAVRAAAGGLAAFDRSRLALMLATEPEPPAEEAEEEALSGAQARGEVSAPQAPLTAREQQVLQLLASGMPNKSIARRLSISPHTAKFHVASILSKLGASSRTEAVSIGARGGYLML